MPLLRPGPPAIARVIGGSSFVIFGINAWWWPAAAAVFCIAMFALARRTRRKWKGALIGLAILLFAAIWVLGFAGGRRIGRAQHYHHDSRASGVGSLYNVAPGNSAHGLPPAPAGVPRVWYHHQDMIVQMRLDWMYTAGLALGVLLAASGAVVCWRLEIVYTPPHLCDNCQYDLRGVTATLCPECGASREDPSLAG